MWRRVLEPWSASLLVPPWTTVCKGWMVRRSRWLWFEGLDLAFGEQYFDLVRDRLVIFVCEFTKIICWEARKIKQDCNRDFMVYFCPAKHQISQVQLRNMVSAKAARCNWGWVAWENDLGSEWRIKIFCHILESLEFLQHMLIASWGQHRPFNFLKQELWMSRALFHVGAVLKGNLSGYLAAWDCAYILWSRNISSRHSYFNLQYK